MTDSHDNAAFDALVSAIEALQERIHRDGDTIGSNEIRTRTALVDPLLTALGWDTTDPAMVIPEYAAGGGVADYALLKVTQDGNTPVIAFIEAKRLHEPLESHRAQMLTYANMVGVKYAGLTNGDRWELYEVFKEAPLHERRIVDMSLRNESAFECAVKLLPLKWPILGTGEAFSLNRIHDLLFEALGRKAPPSTIRMLLDKGASLDKRGDRIGGFREEFIGTGGLSLGWAPIVPMLSSWTPLHLAALNSTEPAIVSLLLDYGADIDATTALGWTPLHCATRPQSNPDIVALLIEHGADVRARTPLGTTVLHDAVELNSDPATVRLLLEHGGYIEETDDLGHTLLHLAMRRKTSPVIIELLLDYGADITTKTISDETVLHQTVRHNSNVGVVALLLDRGADVGAVDDIGATPLHRAAALCPNPEMTALLLDRGADIEARDKLGQTPLHSAVKWNPQPAVVTLLLDRGADIEVTDIELRTPLYHAIYNDNPEVIRLLVDRSSHIRVWDQHGMTPYRLAQRLNADEEILRLLREQ